MGITVHPNARALIFDLDGTLSDSLPVHLKTWEIIGEKYGFRFDHQILYEMTGRPTIEFARRVVDQYGLHETPENIVKMKQELFWKYASLLKPHQPVVNVVLDHHGKIPMAIGTGASRRSTEVQLEALGINNYFNVIVTADDVTRHKPQPETFLKCAELMGVNAQECQVFEDGVLGMEAAQTAGMLVTDVRPYTY